VAAYFRCISYDTGSYWNGSQVNDDYVHQEKAKMYEAFNTLDWKTINSIHAELLKYVLDQAWVIPMPLSYSYVVWWPWVKNYHGELAVSWAGGPGAAGFVWIDQDMKATMTGRK
jgi:peptide/nickel transport system substrate-binding protein